MHVNSNHSHYVKRSVVLSFINRASIIAEKCDVITEASNIRQDMPLKLYPQQLTDSVLRISGINEIVDTTDEIIFHKV
jgi:hypothetical protein